MAQSISTSSTGESPSPVILKRKRTKRHRTLPLSSGSSNTTEEEEDMANCLILLAQGHTFPATEASNAVYECKTCSKCFPSFQALGGHRASHKKPKMAALETELLSSMAKPMASSSSGGGGGGGGGWKQRTHDCSICGSEFSSGQALGGHMRRHRPAVLLDNGLEINNKKEKRVLMLDLNLPAPADDEPFVAGKSLVFSPVTAAALVDCHY